MSVYLPETEVIYFPKTREYFQEVLSSYSIGNYRSATVMLYSVAVCDILFKLQELKDMYNDPVAEEILKEVDKARDSRDGKSRSRWEKEFLDSVYKKTKLLDTEAYTNLNHLYDHRNFSAHPALNENYALIAPSRETTIAHMKNTLNGILIKPPIFIKNVIHALTEDLRDRQHIFQGADDKLAIYLNNKYYSRMTDSMKQATLKAFWKFCFCMPDDEDCSRNIVINRMALSILVQGFEKETLAFIREQRKLFSVSREHECVLNLIVFLSEYPWLYQALPEDAQLEVDAKLKEDFQCRCVAWFKYPVPSEHFAYLTASGIGSIPEKVTGCMMEHYAQIGQISALLDFFIWYFGKSRSFDAADCRFDQVISPYLDKMSSEQIRKLISVINENRQIHGRGRAWDTNGCILFWAKRVLPRDFAYEEYPHFSFDPALLMTDSQEAIEKNTAVSECLPL